MKTTQYLRKTATVVSGAALLLALAGSAFALGGGNTPVTNLHGVTITSALDGTDTCYTINLTKNATFDYAATSAYAGGTGTINKIGGFFIYSSAQVQTAGTPPSGFSTDTLIGSTVSGATGYDTSFGAHGSPIMPGGSAVFCFKTAAPTGATFVLDIFQTNPGNPFNNTGRISFARPLSPPPPASVPEPGSTATLSLGSLGLLCMVLIAHKRGDANDMA